MKIELKSIQYSAAASQETTCYSANLYIDGRKIGTVGNHGHGASDEFHGDRAAFDAADTWCRANLPKLIVLDDQPQDADLELHCHTLVDDWRAAKHLRSTLRTNIVFLHPVDGLLYQVRHRGEIERTAAAVTREHPGANILNGQPFAAALALYRTATAP